VERAVRVAGPLLVLAAVSLSASLAAGCRRESGDPEAEGTQKAPPAEAVAVPVRVAPVARAELSRVVSAPGQTNALAQQKVRAPFAGTLVELSVTDGDSVRRGQVLGAIVARETAAAVDGAQEMQRNARTPEEKADAERALALAERNVVRAAIHAGADGVVISHAATASDRVAEDQELLTIAERDSLVFVAGVTQSDLASVRAGQTVSVELAGRTRPIAGAVHDVLPAANPGDFTAPVRVDLRELPPGMAIGLFGTARITVESREGVVVPDAAILRDDVSGVSRVALVRDGRAHWVDVVTGLRGPSGTEIVSPELSPSDSVVVTGQVGLPEGARLTIRS
jgi:multidrug efflux pump subunit AcrA (membrane-fusion protein)